MFRLNPLRVLRTLGLAAVLLGPVFAQDALAVREPASFDGLLTSDETAGPTIPGVQDLSEASDVRAVRFLLLSGQPGSASPQG
jgi:hypothetical protein